MPRRELPANDAVRRHFSLGQRSARRSQRTRLGLLPLIAGAVLVLGGSAFALDELVFKTPNGTFVVQIDDKEVESRFKNGELQILDKEGKLQHTLKPAERTKDLPPGTFQIRVAGADGLTVDVDEFIIKKGERVTIRVKLLPNDLAKTEPPAPEAKGAPLGDGAPRLNWKIEAKVRSNCLAFSNDGAEIFRSYYTPPHRVYIDSAKDGSSITPLKPLIQSAHITSIRVGPDDFLALTMSSHMVTIQDRLKQGIHATMGVEKTIEAVAIAKQRLAYLVPDAPDEIGVHSLRDGKLIESFKLPQARPIGRIDCSPDGKTVVALSTDGELFVKLAAAPTFKSIFKTAAPSTRNAKLSPDLAHVVVAINQELHVLETATGKEYRRLAGHDGEVVEVLFTPESRYLLSLSKDKTFRTWDVEAGKQLHRVDLASPGKAMALSPDGRSVAIATDDDSLRSYKLAFPGDPVVAKKETGPASGAPALLKAPFTKEQGEKARAEWAKFLKFPERKELDLGKGVKLGLVLIPPGQFLMGEEKHSRRITIRRPFYAAVTETTQEQFAAVMGSNPSAFAPDGNSKSMVSRLDTSKFPVERVVWEEALEFAAKIKAQVPTEAQWEYACRAGTTTDYNFGNWLNGTQANCDGTRPYGTTTAGPNLQRTTTVASYAPNAFGLYDMHGNVREWCYPFDVKTTSLPDPETPVKPALNNPIYRGGSWHIDAHICRSTFRMGYEPTARLPYTGFRVIVPVPDPSKPDKGAEESKKGENSNSLFNGKDTTGWAKASNVPSTAATLMVKNGMLVGNGGGSHPNGFFQHEKDSWGDFQLSVEGLACANDAEGAAIRVLKRGEKWSGYLVSLGAGDAGTVYRFPGFRVLLPAEKTPMKAGDPIKLEVTAKGNEFTVLVNGKEVVKGKDADSLYDKGHIGLRCAFNSSVTVKKIEAVPIEK